MTTNPEFGFKRCPTYKGVPYGSLHEMQMTALGDIIHGGVEGETESSLKPLDAAQHIIENKNAVVNILTLTETSLPKARGVKKPRKKPATPELPLAGKEAKA